MLRCMLTTWTIKLRNKETEGQQEGQLEAETSVPTFASGQTIPQIEQIVLTTVKAEPSAGQAQGAFNGQPESSSPFVIPNSLLGNSPSSQQSGFGSDFTFPHIPFQQTRDNHPNSPPSSSFSSSCGCRQFISCPTEYFHDHYREAKRSSLLPW